MHCLVVGMSGVGKSTLLHKVSADTGIPVLHAATELVRFMGMPLDYERLRAMDQNFTLKEWEATAAEIARIYRDKSYFLDGHIMNLIEGRVTSRAGKWVGLQDVLVMLQASPVTILKRVSTDATRNRDLFPAQLPESHKLAMIEDCQQQMETLFLHLAKQYHLPYRIIVIENLNAAVAELEQFIRELPA